MALVMRNIRILTDGLEFPLKIRYLGGGSGWGSVSGKTKSGEGANKILEEGGVKFKIGTGRDRNRTPNPPPHFLIL